MDLLTLALLCALGGAVVKHGEQRQRIALLAQQLGPFQIEKLMARLDEGYLRALDENDPERRAQIWALHTPTEQTLAQQFGRFADGFAKLPPDTTRVNRNPLPHAHRWLPDALNPGFDARALMTLHAQGISRAVDNRDGLDEPLRARTLLAELYLMQHSCHWFCRSRTLASARLVARHHTTHEQVIEAVSPTTRQAYLALIDAGPQP